MASSTLSFIVVRLREVICLSKKSTSIRLNFLSAFLPIARSISPCPTFAVFCCMGIFISMSLYVFTVVSNWEVMLDTTESFACISAAADPRHSTALFSCLVDLPSLSSADSFFACASFLLISSSVAFLVYLRTSVSASLT